MDKAVKINKPILIYWVCFKHSCLLFFLITWRLHIQVSLFARIWQKWTAEGKFHWKKSKTIFFHKLLVNLWIITKKWQVTHWIKHEITSNNNCFIYNFHFCKAHLHFCNYKYCLKYFVYCLFVLLYLLWAVKADELEMSVSIFVYLFICFPATKCRLLSVWQWQWSQLGKQRYVKEFFYLFKEHI